MKKLIVVVCLLLVIAMVAHGEVSVQVTPQTVALEANSSFTLNLALTSVDDKIHGLQLLPVLPAGLTLTQKSNTAGWPMPGDVVAYSPQGAEQKEVSLSLEIQAGALEPGEYVISFANSRWAGPDSYTMALAIPQVQITIENAPTPMPSPSQTPAPSPTPNPTPTASPTPLPPNLGDTTEDGKLEVDDVLEVINFLIDPLEGATLNNADLTGDGDIDIEDLTRLIDLLLSLSPTP